MAGICPDLPREARGIARLSVPAALGGRTFCVDERPLDHAPSKIGASQSEELKQFALALGLEPRSAVSDIVEALAQRRFRAGLKPRVVATTPREGTVSTGKAVDLSAYPAAWPRPSEEGPSTDRVGLFVARSPDGSWVNWSNGRIKLLSRNRLTSVVSPQAHIGRIHAMWRALGRAMPFAVALGVDPVLSLVGGMPIPAYDDEADVAGAIRGTPVEIIRCETNDLYVPASAAVVIEGVVSMTEMTKEWLKDDDAGPLWPSIGMSNPIFHVGAVTSHGEPSVTAGLNSSEGALIAKLASAAEVLFRLREAGLPIAAAMPMLTGGDRRLVLTVPRGDGTDAEDLCQKVGALAFKPQLGDMFTDLFLLGDDIDTTSIETVARAIIERCPADAGMKPALAPKLFFVDDAEMMTSSRAVHCGLVPV